MNVLQKLEQFRRAVQKFAQTLPDDEALEIATVYPTYKIGVAYEVGDFFTYGENSVGDPQLYKVVQSFTSQSNWIPGEIPSLCIQIGLTADGYVEWSPPTGAHDAYNKGDIVYFKGTLYVSLLDGNAFSPETYPTGWEVYSE